MTARIALFFALMVFACTATAANGGREAVRKTMENSTLVTGTIDIDTEGKVLAHSLDHAEKLPDFVRRFVAASVAPMRFEPVRVDGKVVKARAKMGLRLVAKQGDNGNYQLRLAGASFGDSSGEAGEHLRSRDLKPPSYPAGAYLSNVTGVVYLVLKVGTQGTVEDVAVEQTNLTALGPERLMEMGRKVLERASLDAARGWRFDVPTTGEEADKPYWSVRVPVDFKLVSRRGAVSAYGSWDAYYPGPKHHIPWISDEENRQRPDAMVAGVAHPVGSGLKLLTPLSEG
jgi:TonB family protein